MKENHCMKKSMQKKTMIHDYACETLFIASMEVKIEFKSHC